MSNIALDAIKNSDSEFKKWIRRHMPSSAVVIADITAALAIYTGSTTIVTIGTLSSLVTTGAATIGTIAHETTNVNTFLVSNAGVVKYRTGAEILADIGAIGTNSPTFTGTVTIPSPFTIGATSMTATAAKLNLLASAAGSTGTNTTNIVFSTSPVLTTPSLGVATATSINGNIFTTGTYTLTGTAAKTLTFTNTITLTGTDAQTYTFPTSSATIARTDAANTFTGHQTIEGVTSTGATGTGKFVFDASPVLTGTPTAPTATLGDNSTNIATTAFVIANRSSLGSVLALSRGYAVTY